MTKSNISTRDQIRSLLESDRPPAALDRQLEKFDSAELLHAVFQLTEEEQRKLLSAVSAEKAAHLVEEFPSSHGADLIEDMPAQDAAPIVEEMASNYRVDLLAEMDQEDTEAIFEYLEDDDVQEIRDLSAYPPDVAGGLMMTEFATYPRAAIVRDVVNDLTGREGDY